MRKLSEHRLPVKKKKKKKGMLGLAPPRLSYSLLRISLTAPISTAAVKSLRTHTYTTEQMYNMHP